MLISSGDHETSQKIILMLPESYYEEDYYEIGIAFKRLRMDERAHTIFSKIYSSYDTDPEYLSDFAQVKIAIANKNYKSKERNWATIRRLRGEAIELLRRAINLFEDERQKAWCWFHLAKTLQFNRSPIGVVDEAYNEAIRLQPDEKSFKFAFKKWKAYLGNKSITLDD